MVLQKLSENYNKNDHILIVITTRNYHIRGTE